MKVLVVGGTGFLGQQVCLQARARGWDVAATNHTSRPTDTASVEWYRCDITDPHDVGTVVERAHPDVVVNAAYVQHGDDVGAICADGAGTLSQHAAAHSARMIHLSTDLVFDGTLGRSYREDDPVSPISAYGRAKAEGEEQVLAAHRDALVVRTSIIYGASIAPQETLVQRAVDGGDIAFFVDEWRTPVHVHDLGNAVLTLSASNHTGMLHVAGNERLNRLEFARVLARLLGLSPSSLVGRTRDPHLGPRPEDVSLDCSVAAGIGLEPPGPTKLLADQS